MNIRELWDTVVLRDILGYTLPGAVTLLAVAVLWSGADWTPHHGLAGHGGAFGILARGTRVVWEPWVAAAVLLPLSFVVGHVQILVTEFMEGRLPEWDHARRAHRFLSYERGPNGDQQRSGPGIGDQYRRWAIEVLRRVDRGCFEEALRGPFAPGEGPYKKDDEGKGKGVGYRLCKLFGAVETKAETDDEVRRDYRLWKLCDYYVQTNAPQLHATYMGRYYVLALLFSNLGISLMVLGLCCSLRIAGGPGSQHHGVVGFLSVVELFVGLLLFFKVRSRCWECKAVRRSFVAVFVVFGVGLLLVGFWWPQCQGWAGAALLVLAGFGLVHRSGSYREQFVVRVFPIFYTLTLAGRESSVGKRGEG